MAAKMASKTITIIGSLNMDLVTVTPYVPKGGETMTASSFSTGAGGKGANQAVACARLSRPKPPRSQTTPPTSLIAVKMLGGVGQDEFGPRLIAGMAQDGIDVSGIRQVENQTTGVAVILVESSNGENRIMLSPGANHTLLASHFLTPPSLGTPLPDLLIMQLEIPLATVLQILKTAQAANVPVLLNPAPAVPLSDEVYTAITHLIVNETEAALLSNRSLADVSVEGFDWSSISDDFIAKGAQNVVITLGSKGAFWASSGSGAKSNGYVPAAKVEKVVDTTAAGDTFVGAYAVQVVQEGEAGLAAIGGLGEVVRRACIASGKTVEKEGAQNAIPWADEVEW